MALTHQDMESMLWQAVDILRGQIDSADYKQYIVSMLFLKWLSDRFDEEVELAVEAGVPHDVAVTDVDEHQFAVPAAARWSNISGAVMDLGETLNVASAAIEDANVGRLDGMLGGTNWNDETKLGSPADRESIIRRLVNHFSDMDLRDHNLRRGEGRTGNILGDSFERLINRFADDAWNTGGKFYTPRPLVRLLVELLQPCEGMRICDPTMGSGGMLIYTADYVQEHGGNRQDLVLHGQEQNLGALAIGKLNLLLHGLPASRLAPGDVITEPGLLDEEGHLLSYDRVIANPPFGLKNWGYKFAPDDPHHRFDRYGAIPPPARGDFAFLLHMLSVTNAQGMAGVVIPHGVLFRGGTEGKIRRGIVEEDLFEAVIGLAPKLFFRASIPVAICVLNKNKPAERRGRVLFIDAAQEDCFRQGRAQNVLDQEHIDKIVDAYQRFDDVDRFAHVAGLSEIEFNDFNLNINRYVDTREHVAVMGVKAALAQLSEAEQRRDEAAARMDQLLAEMGFAQ